MIIAKNLVKDYGGNRAVDHVGFEVKTGEILGFLGPNGAGKSTTMKMITGFLPPSEGTASIGNYDVLESPVEAKRLLGYLPENGPLYPEMTTREFLEFAAEVRGLEGEDRRHAIARVSEICHLETVLEQTIETLSKGFRQRVGLAQALLHDPPCLILDEPTDGLDPNQKREVRNLIASMAETKAIILSTHILEEVEAMCNRVIIIAGGRIIADETPQALRRRHPLANAAHLQLDNPPVEEARSLLEKIPSVEQVEMDPDSGKLILYGRGDAEIIPDVWQLARRENWEIHSLESATIALDEVFHELTRTQIS